MRASGLRDTVAESLGRCRKLPLSVAVPDLDDAARLTLALVLTRNPLHGKDQARRAGSEARSAG